MAETKTTKQLLNVAKAAAMGAIIGIFLVRKGNLPEWVRGMAGFPIGMRASLGLWVLFSVYWSIAARKSAPTRTSESVWSRQWHLILVNVALLVLVLPVPGLTRRFLPSSYALVGAGLAVQAAFIGLAVWARRNLGSNWSGEVRIAAGHQLVRSGPYRFVRHPIYTAVLGMYCGTGLISGQVHAVVALVMVTLAYWRKIRLEERALGETFGGDFESYRSDTWALVPLVY